MAPTPKARSSGGRQFQPKDLDPSLADAVDAPGLIWTTQGTSNWTAQTSITHDGVDAAQSGSNRGMPDFTYLETTVSGPGLLTFWWKVSSEGNFDFLRFLLDGSEVAEVEAISGEVDWQQKVVAIPSGSHLLLWDYAKDFSFEAGADAGWLDEVVFTPDVPAPEIVVEQPEGTNLMDGTSSRGFGFVKPGQSNQVTFTIRNLGTTNLTGLALTQDGTNSADFTIGSLGATNLAPGTNTTFTVTFAPSAGTARNRSAALHIASDDADENPFDIAVTGTTPPGRKQVAVMGCSYLTVRDAQGRENTKLSELAALKVPGVALEYGGEDPWMNMAFDSDVALTLGNASCPGGLEVEVTEFDNAGRAISLLRYRFAPGTNAWRMALLPGQAPDLKVDQDHDGTYAPEELVAATHSSAGGAVDTTAPSIALEFSLAVGRIVVSLTGTDGAQPAPALRYTLDGGPVQTYSAPLDFPPGDARGLKVFAEDAMGNTSGLIETTVNPVISFAPGAGGTFAIEWPLADGYVLEETSALGLPWTTSTNKVARAGLQEKVSIPIDSAAPKFFQLRAQRIER